MQRRSTLGMIRSGITDPESWRRSTVSMVTSFVLGITFSHEILVKLRRPFGTALRASASISLKFHSKMLSKKKPVTLATAAVRHPRPSAYLTRSLTLTLSYIQYIMLYALFVHHIRSWLFSVFFFAFLFSFLSFSIYQILIFHFFNFLYLIFFIYFFQFLILQCFFRCPILHFFSIFGLLIFSIFVVWF